MTRLDDNDRLLASDRRSKPGFMFLLPWELHHPGGVNQVVANLFDQMRRRGNHAPLIVINSWEHRNASEGDSTGRHVLRLRIRSPEDRRQFGKGLAVFLVTLPAGLRALRRVLSQHNVAAVNAHFPTLAALQIVLLKRLRAFRGKLILSFHGQDIRGAQATKGVERSLWKYLLRSADAVVACSDSLRREIVAFDGKAGVKVRTIHNGLDAELIFAERGLDASIEPLLKKAPFILNVATFEHKKGQDVLIRAFAQTTRLFPTLRLVLVGRSGETRVELERLVEELGLQDKVLFFENVPHERIAAFMGAATIFCLPSRSEPFGIVLLEAGAFAVPVIASDVDGIPEIIEHDVNGRLTQAEDPDALAAEITRLLENPEESKSLGLRLREHVLKHFTWERAQQQYEGLA